MLPSEVLTQAADLIRDQSAHLPVGPWRVTVAAKAEWQDEELSWDIHGRNPFGGALASVDSGRGVAEWIALLNPSVAPHLEAWLRDEAEQYARLDHLNVDFNPEHPPMAFARSLLSQKEET
jgi:hypothetical protein